MESGDGEITLNPFSLGASSLGGGADHCPDQDDFIRITDLDLFVAISKKNELGIIVVDQGAEILSCNYAAQSLLEKASGLTRKGKSLVAVHSKENPLLSAGIKRAIIANADEFSLKFEPPVLLISRQEHLPLTVSIVPARILVSAGVYSTAVNGDPAAVILIADPEFPLAESIGRICRLYGLTPAETRLAELLIDGLTLAEIADVMRLKLSTVRVYLKQIFMKTGVHRQPMLIRTLLTARIPMTSSID